MATKNWWIWLICGTLLGILASVLFNRGCVAPKTVEHRIYRSDTVVRMVHEFSRDTIKVPYETILPEHVTMYRDPDTSKQWITFHRDTSLIFPGTDSLIRLNNNFVTKFIDAPKLVEGNFTKDSLSLTLFDSSGTIVKRTWPLNYTSYNYHFRNNEVLGTERIRLSEAPLALPKNITTQSNAYAYYSILHGGFKVAADFWVTKQRWSIGAIGELSTYTKYGDIRLGAKYSIK